jgi:hypothetical protein
MDVPSGNGEKTPVPEEQDIVWIKPAGEQAWLLLLSQCRGVPGA